MKPIVILSRPDQQCATFVWPGRDFYIGYRFIEHDPETLGQPLAGMDALPASRLDDMPQHNRRPLPAHDADPLGYGWGAHYVEKDPANRIQLTFQAYADGSAWARGSDNGGAQHREFFFEPVEDGLLMWMRIETDVDIPGAFSVQQCLRFSGETAVPWRQKVALCPELSELDMQARGRPHDTLTWARRDGGWLPFPLAHTEYHTPAGQPLLSARSNGAVDHGLIVRESRDRRLASGMYWQRTSFVSNRHPADCVHSSVDMGPLAHGESRTVHGRFYLVDGSKDDIYRIWQSEFS